MNLNLEKAKMLAWQKEALKNQHRQLQQGTQCGAEALLKGVRRGNHGKRSPRGGANRPADKRDNHKGRGQPQNCKRCGRDMHPRDRCPAKDVKCMRGKHKLRTLITFATYCFSSGRSISIEQVYSRIIGPAKQRLRVKWQADVPLTYK